MVWPFRGLSPGLTSPHLTSPQYGIASTVSLATVVASTTDANATWDVVPPPPIDADAGFRLASPGFDSLYVRDVSRCPGGSLPHVDGMSEGPDIADHLAMAWIW